MFCSKCGKALEDNVRYCSGCGSQIVSASNSTQIADNADTESKVNANSYADMSFTMSIIGLFLCCICFIFGAAAIVLGIMAHKNNATNIAKANTGIIIGSIEVLLLIAAFLY